MAELDRHGVARAGLIASAVGDHAAVAAAVRRHPTRVVGQFMFNPARGDADERLARALEAPELRTICLFPAMHGYRLTDEAVEHTFGRAAARPGTAVFVHCGTLSVGARRALGLKSPFDLSLGQPLELAAVVSRHPDVPVIVPHFGGGLLRQLLMAAEVCPNLHVDTSSSNRWIRYQPGLTLAEVFARTLDVLGPRRVLFGTDSSFFPRGWLRQVLDAQVEALDAIGVGDDERALMLSGNFDRLHPDAATADPPTR